MIFPTKVLSLWCPSPPLLVFPPPLLVFFTNNLLVLLAVLVLVFFINNPRTNWDFLTHIDKQRPV